MEIMDRTVVMINGHEEIEELRWMVEGTSEGDVQLM
jgi:hypothetical protein